MPEPQQTETSQVVDPVRALHPGSPASAGRRSSHLSANNRNNCPSINDSDVPLPGILLSTTDAGAPPPCFRCFIDARVLIGELISAWLREQLSYRRPYSPSRAHGGPSAFFP